MDLWAEHEMKPVKKQIDFLLWRKSLFRHFDCDFFKQSELDMRLDGWKQMLSTKNGRRRMSEILENCSFELNKCPDVSVLYVGPEAKAPKGLKKLRFYVDLSSFKLDGEENWTCRECNVKFSFVETFNHHKRIHGPKADANYDIIMQKAKEERFKHYIQLVEQSSDPSKYSKTEIVEHSTLELLKAWALKNK